jgi:hypothetical protein
MSGWCGTDQEHCVDVNSTSENEIIPTLTSVPPPDTGGTCGEGDRGDGICADGTCCSKFGKVFLDIVILIA